MYKAFVTISAAVLTAAAVYAEQVNLVSNTTAVKQVYGHYILIQSSLASDTLKGVPEAAATIVKLSRNESKLPATITAAAEKVGQAADIESARAAFKDLSDGLIAHRKTDKTLIEQYYVIHCSMAFNDTGASWLQATKTVRNPYFGARMLRCGAIKD